MEKPRVLTTLQAVLPSAFEALRRSYGVPEIYYLELDSIDSVTGDKLSRHVEIAAITMRKLQLLKIHSPLGVQTPNDVVIGLCAEITRALASLIRTTPSLAAEHRTALVEALRAVQECGTVIGTMTPPGEIVIFE